MRRAKGVFAELVADCDTGCTELQNMGVTGRTHKKGTTARKPSSFFMPKSIDECADRNMKVPII